MAGPELLLAGTLAWWVGVCGSLRGHHFGARGWRYAEEPLCDHLSWEGWFWGGPQPSPEHLHSQGLRPVGSSVSLRLGLSAERFLCTTVRPPAPAACIPASPPLLPVCSWVHTCHCTHTYRLAVSLPSPSSPASALASRHWSWCRYSEDSEGQDCRLLWLGLTCAII